MPHFYRSCDTVLYGNARRKKTSQRRRRRIFQSLLVIRNEHSSRLAYLSLLVHHKAVWLAKPQFSRSTLQRVLASSNTCFYRQNAHQVQAFWQHACMDESRQTVHQLCKQASASRCKRVLWLSSMHGRAPLRQETTCEEEGTRSERLTPRLYRGYVNTFIAQVIRD